MWNCNYYELRFSIFSIRLPGNTNKIDAIAVSVAVGNVVAEVRARGRDALPVGQHAHVAHALGREPVRDWGVARPQVRRDRVARDDRRRAALARGRAACPHSSRPDCPPPV